MQVHVHSGDISRVNCDAIITAINPQSDWCGGIDRVIQRVAGNYFHKQAKELMPLMDGQVVVAYGEESHGGAFTNVVFVVDGQKKPFHEIIFAGLMAAHVVRFMSVALPTIRMGAAIGLVEHSREEVVAEMVFAVSKFREVCGNDGLDNINFVVYADAQAESMLRLAFPD